MLKKVLFAVLAVVLFGGSALAFAWWDRLETDETVTIGVGEGVTVSVSLEEQTTGKLVPAGVILKTGDVTEVVIDFDLELSTDVIDALDLGVAISNLEIGGNAALASSLVNTVISGATEIHNSTVTVTITVTLNMPADQTEYDAIANEDITFDVTFTASE